MAFLAIAGLVGAAGCATYDGAGDALGPGGASAVQPVDVGETVAPWGASVAEGLVALPLSESSVFIMRPPPVENEGYPEARVSGVLAVLDGGCLGLSPSTTLVWPYGTVNLPGGAGVQTPDGRAFRLGDEVDGGGGYGTVAFSGSASGYPGVDTAFLNPEFG